MLLSSGMAVPMKSSALKLGRKRIGLRVTLASTNKSGVRIDTEQLRTQLDQLHAEAEIARSKANNARLRLMRLSEVAENLQRRAVTDVVLGKENEVRELLMQKKKLMQALERTKRRLEVLDELSLKINEAISLKENQLIGNVTLIPDIRREGSSQEIRIISLKDNVDKDTKRTDAYDPQNSKPCDEQEVETMKHKTSPTLDNEQLNKEDVMVGTQFNDSMMNDLQAMSSYEGFLEHIDGQLRQMELDICNFLSLSTMFLESKQKQMNSKVQQTSEILEQVRCTRERIANIMKRRESSN